MIDKALREIHWHGDSLYVVRMFPRSTRIRIGSELYLPQLGEKALHCRPFASVGRGVWEIRIKDKSGAFSVFYVVRRRDRIYVLHAFQKKTRKTRKSDLEVGKARFGELLAQIR